MNAPSHAVGQLVQVLKEARISRGDTQRELAERVGFGQNRLALIEAGQVDLRSSTLVQVARALDLELVLIPRRMLPAVQSLTASPASRSQVGRHSVRGTPIRILRHLQRHVAALKHVLPASEALSGAANIIQALIEVGPDLGASTLPPLRRSVHWLALARANTAEAEQLLAKAVAPLHELYQTLPAVTRPEKTSEVQRAAYSLEDETS